MVELDDECDSIKKTITTIAFDGRHLNDDLGPMTVISDFHRKCDSQTINMTGTTYT